MATAKSQQAKDITDTEILAAIRDICDQRASAGNAHWAFRWDLYEAFPGSHEKVVQAKIRALLRRELVTGCGCMCRGDLEVTDAGAELARAVPARPRKLRYRE